MTTSMLPTPARRSDDLIDRFEAELVKHGSKIAGLGQTPEGLPVTHRFTPGMYIREIFMPAGVVLTSKIHRTEHPFVVLTGVADVFTDDLGAVRISAPCIGITKPGTRRVLHIIEDCRWATFHATDLKTVEEIESEIIEFRINPHLIPELEASS